AEIQVTDCRGGGKDSVFALVKSILSTLPAPPLPEPLPEAPDVPMSYISNLSERIDSPNPLSAQDQITLLFELEQELDDNDSREEVRDLLLRLRRRDELLAKISAKIDEALQRIKNIEDKVPPPQRDVPRRPQPPATTKFCAKCGTHAAADAAFCAKCGTQFQDAQDEATTTSGVPGSKSRQYLCKDSDIQRVIADLKGWLESQSFDTQQINTENQGVMLQIKKRGGWRDWVGMSTSLNILFHQSSDTLTVQIGAGKWADKLGAGAVSLFVLWPLAITAGYGAWEQLKMPDRIFDFIGARLACK